MSTELGMFPLGSCDCGHTMFMIDEGEPCPVCMESARPHDCPLLSVPRDRRRIVLRRAE